MTEENKRKNILEEMEKAAKTIDAATLLFDNGFFDDAISRLYYFILHNIRALLLTKGLEPKSHEGAPRLLGLHFISEDFVDFKKEAEELSHKIKAYLRRKHYL